MRLLIRKEEFEASAKLDSDRYGGGHGTRPRGGEIHHASVQLIMIIHGEVFCNA